MGSLTELAQFAPPQPLPLEKLLAQHQLKADVVVHVGAHEGQELESYLACGFREIIYCEPHPQTFARLELHAGFWRSWLQVFRDRFGANGLPTITTVARAITDHSGTVTFHQTDHEMCSSILPIQDDRVKTVNSLEVDCCTLDGLLEELGIAPERVTFINLDAQGAELKILQGGPRVMARVPLILTEVNEVPRYQGAPPEEEVHAHLEQLGFRLLSRFKPYPSYPAADALYAR